MIKKWDQVVILEESNFYRGCYATVKRVEHFKMEGGKAPIDVATVEISTKHGGVISTAVRLEDLRKVNERGAIF